MNSKRSFYIEIIVVLCLFIESKMMVAKSNSLIEKEFVFKSFLGEVGNSSTSSDLCVLYNHRNQSYDLNYLYNSTMDYSERDYNFLVNFNFCKNTFSQCKNKTASVIWIGELQGVADNCVVISGENTQETKWGIIGKI